MGEEFPLDPNQVQPPQEGQPDNQPDENEAGHIEVASPDDGQQPNEEDIPSTYIRNKEKAEVMAHAENDAFDGGERFPENASLRAGIDYDMNIVKNKVKGREPSRLLKQEALAKQSLYDITKRNQFLKYSDVITEHYKEHGDKPSLALEALAAVHKLVLDTGYEDFEVDAKGDFFAPNNVSVTFDKHENVIVSCGDEQKNRFERFTLSMFHGAHYERAESEYDDPDYDEVVVTKRRRLTPLDVKQLEDILAPAIAFQAEQKQQSDET